MVMQFKGFSTMDEHRRGTAVRRGRAKRSEGSRLDLIRVRSECWMPYAIADDEFTIDAEAVVPLCAHG